MDDGRLSDNRGWIGVDLDGTLAEYHGWVPGHIGKPVPAMLARVKAWLAEGREVRIFTARANAAHGGIAYREEHAKLIDDWCLEHIGQKLTVTCEKDYQMEVLWDDRCVQVIPNEGAPVAEVLARCLGKCPLNRW